MEGTDQLHACLPGTEHIDDAMSLVREAGWNQLPADWRMMMRIGQMIGTADAQGKLIACALVLPYEPEIGWVSMVLVAKAWRRNGLATDLIKRSLSLLDKRGLTAVLDATPDGQQVYKKMGFTPVFEFVRWRRSAIGADAAAAAVHADRETQKNAVIALDTSTFGANRRDILLDIMGRGSPWLYAQDGSGFGLTRKGNSSLQIGPVSSLSETGAIALFDALASAESGQVIVDIPCSQRAFSDAARHRGFEPVREFVRMLKGRANLADATNAYALAGPELG